MALLNPPEIRPTLLVLIATYLADRRGERDDTGHLVDTLAPPTLTPEGKHQLDVKRNLRAAMTLGIVVSHGDQVSLADNVSRSARNGPAAVAQVIRQRVLAEELNTAPWGKQLGARDLTNSLAWFLSFSPSAAPANMEGQSPSAKELQEADFGPRQGVVAINTDDDEGEEDDSSGWPISNTTRWQSFRRWSCSLGFAWATPRGRLVPDPTTAVRDVVPAVFDGNRELTAEEFIAGVGRVLPVLETGRYRQFVESNWRRAPTEHQRLSVPTSDALERLETEGLLKLEDRADAPRASRADGRTFSHVRRGRGK